MKRYVFALSRMMAHHHEVLAALVRPDFRGAVPEPMRPYFEGLNERLRRIGDTFAGNKDWVNTAFDIYVSHMSFRSNQTMQLLAGLAAIVLPATVIPALASAMVDAKSFHDPLGPITLLALTVLATLGCLVLFRRRRWI